MSDLAALLAGHRDRCYVIAPAGYGKTHLIAEAVRRAHNRQLVLTHTYAGVDALHKKLRELRVPARYYRVDTIASWALRLCLAYSHSSGWTLERPDRDQWTQLYRVCASFCDLSFVRRLIRASYGGLYVDEYQDCSAPQHSLVLQLARDLPCRVLGDPLQAIFDFDHASPIQWEVDVEPHFNVLGPLNIPHRWVRAGAPKLGAWLNTARTALERRAPLDLSTAPVAGVQLKRSTPDQSLFRIQRNCCAYFRCDRDETVIAIHRGHQQFKAKCHKLAKALGGKFSSIEEIEGKALFALVRRIENAATSQKRLEALVAFAERCLTNVSNVLPEPVKRGELTKITAKTRNAIAGETANACLAEWRSGGALKFLTTIRSIPTVNVVRADLFNRAIAVFQKHVSNPHLTLAEAADKYHTEFRYKGRPVGRRRLIGTTLLVKGLEFDHAVVLDATSLTRRELYVALTRGAKSLTIVSSADVLSPDD